MEKANALIRSRIESAGLRYWQVADVLGMHDSNFSRMLRRELNPESMQLVLAAIEKAKERYCNERS